MAEDLKIKLSVDISAVEQEANKIPDVIERAKRPRRPPAGGRQPGPRPGSGGAGGGQGGGGTNVPPVTPPGGAGGGSGDDSGKGGKGGKGGKPAKPAEDIMDEFEKDLGNSIKRGFSPLKIAIGMFEWFAENAQRAMQKAAELTAISRATDITAENLQKFGYAARQAGVDSKDLYTALEVGKQKMGKGVFSGGDTVVALERLGFSIQDIRSGAVTSQDVLMKLAEIYKKNGNDARVAAIGASIYGDSFHKLIPMLRMGKEGIEQLGESAPFMSDNTVRALNSMSKAIDTLKESAVNFVGSIVAAPVMVADNLESTFRVANAISKSDTGYDALKLMYNRRESGITTPWSDESVDFGMREDNMTDEQWAQSIKKFVEDNKEFAGRKDAILADLPKFVADLKAGKIDFNTGSLPMASSLQAMGGGDTLSAINRGPMEDIAQFTRETAENTRFLPKEDKNAPHYNKRLLAPGY